MKPNVLLYSTLPDDLLLRLKNHCTVYQTKNIDPLYDPELVSLLRETEGILGSGGNVNAQFLSFTPKLRAASTISVGYDNFDVPALTKRNIALMHTPTVLTETVADTTMGLILASARRMINLSERVKKGEWKQSITPDWYGSDVHHKTLGIVGMGRIGKAVARRGHCGFGMNILYFARSQHQDAEQQFSARHCDLDTLLEQSDFVCVTLPLTTDTFQMFGKEQFEKMKKSGIFINIGRGAVVDERALINALQNGTIQAAGLDVFEKEPLPIDSPLLQLDNVVVMPHIGSATHETRYNMAACAVDNLIKALSGNVTENCVNPQVFQH